MSELSLAETVECLVRGFAAVKSFTRPCEAALISDNIRMVSDPQNPLFNKKLTPRVIELVAIALRADAVIAASKQLGLDKYYICAVIPIENDLKDAIADYKSAGCRLMRREPVFAIQTDSLQQSIWPPHIQRVTTARQAAAVAKKAGAKQIIPEYLTEDDCNCRLYAAFLDTDYPVGWVRSVRTSPTHAYTSNLYVSEAYRRKGIGRELMARLLYEDSLYGVEVNALVATTLGANLYPLLGYRQLATLVLFASPKVKASS